MFFLDERGKRLTQCWIRPEIEFPVVAVDDDLLAVQCGKRQIRDTHNGRKSKRTGDNRGMGKRRSLCRDNASNTSWRYQPKVYRADPTADEDAVRRAILKACRCALQTQEYAGAQFPDVH